MQRLAAVLLLIFLAACAPKQETAAMRNPVGYVEIPVTDMDRAVAFYEAVLGYDFERQTIDGYEMALFPFHPGGGGATAALAKGDVYAPSKAGPIVYFSVDSIDAVLERAIAAGARVLFAKKDVGAFGFVAEIEDSEGNRIALSEPAASTADR